MPAFAKLVERLEDRKVEFDVVLLARDSNSIIAKKQIVKIGDFLADFHVRPFINHLQLLRKFKLGRLLDLMIEILYISHCVKLSLRKNYDVFYFDRANVTIGAFYAFF